MRRLWFRAAAVASAITLALTFAPNSNQQATPTPPISLASTFAPVPMHWWHPEFACVTVPGFDCVTNVSGIGQ